MARHSLGWVTARLGEDLLGFANLLWDGLVHAWIQDVIVARSARHRGVGVAVVRACQDAAREAGCDFLHVPRRGVDARRPRRRRHRDESCPACMTARTGMRTASEALFAMRKARSS